MGIDEDYRQIVEGTAIGEVAPRRQIAVSGKDRLSYLQGLLTNDVQALLPGSGCYAAWLTPQGRMLTDLYVLESDGMALLDVPAEEADATAARLDQFLFSEDVQLGSLADSLTGVWVHGPGAAAVLERTLAGAGTLAAWPSCHHVRADFGGEPVVVARIDQLGVPGFCCYLSPSARGGLVAALESAGARQVGSDAIRAARVEAGYPVFGTDMTSDTIPLEAGIEDRAISTTKGCYVGQEVVIRVLHRGHGRVAKKLVGLRLSAAGVRAGARLRAGAKDVGFVTTAAVSPRHGAIALGYVHRDLVVDGAQVTADGDAGPVDATVSVGPIGR